MGLVPMMSNMIEKCRFFPVPQALFTSGLVHKLKPAELTLWLTVLYESQRVSSREFTRSDEAIKELASISPRAMRDARIKLQEYGLIRYSRVQTGVRYILCDPTTRQPFPGPARRERKHSAGAQLPTRSSAAEDESQKQPDSVGTPRRYAGGLHWSEIAN